MHSAGLELTKLTYTMLEDNLIRHRGDQVCSTEYVTPNEKQGGMKSGLVLKGG